MTAKFSASADGTKVTIGTVAEDALQIDATAKIIKALPPYAQSFDTLKNTAGVTAMTVNASGKVTLNQMPNVVAFATCDGTGAGLIIANGISATSRPATGEFHFTLSVAQPDNNYAVFATVQSTSRSLLAQVFSKSTTEFVVLTTNNSAVDTNPQILSVMVMR